MTTAGLEPVDVAEPVLEAHTCLELLDRCGAASLACTTRALPSVVLTTVRVTGSAILLGVGSCREPDRLDGQIVALGAGVAATPRSEGWWVVVRGELRMVDSSARTFELVPHEVEGRAHPAARQGRWWRC